MVPSLRRDSEALAIVAVLGLLLVAGPLLLDSFRLNLLGKYMALAFVAVGIVLTWGYGGVLSLGQGIFFGMKPSTRQRFAALEFDFPEAMVEAEIVAHEAQIAPALAAKLVGIAQRSRALKTRGLDEGVSTRMLIYAGILIRDGVDPRQRPWPDAGALQPAAVRGSLPVPR